MTKLSSKIIFLGLVAGLIFSTPLSTVKAGSFGTIKAQYSQYLSELNSLLLQLIELKDRLLEIETAQTNATTTATSSSSTSTSLTASSTDVIVDSIENLLSKITKQASTTEEKINDLYDNYSDYEDDYEEALDDNEELSKYSDDSSVLDSLGKSLASQGVSPNDVSNNTAAFRRALENYQEDNSPGSVSESAGAASGYVGNAEPESGYKEGESKGDSTSWRYVSANLMVRGVGEAEITDICSGQKFRVRRTGGSNHADVEPVTATDTKAFYQMKNIPSWSGRPVVATMRNGSKVAAAIRPFPHAYDRIGTNGMQGHFDLYFKGSVGHASPNPGSYPNPMMQRNVELATQGKCK